MDFEVKLDLGKFFLDSVSSSEKLSTYFILSLDLNELLNKIMPNILSDNEMLVTIIIPKQTNIFCAWGAFSCLCFREIR